MLPSNFVNFRPPFKTNWRSNPPVMSHADQRSFYTNTMNRRPESLYCNPPNPHYMTRNTYGYPNDYPYQGHPFFYTNQMPNAYRNGDGRYAPYPNMYQPVMDVGMNGYAKGYINFNSTMTVVGSSVTHQSTRREPTPTAKSVPENEGEPLNGTSDVATTVADTHIKEVDENKSSLPVKKYNGISITAIDTNDSYLRRLTEAHKAVDKFPCPNANSDINTDSLPPPATEEVQSKEKSGDDDVTSSVDEKPKVPTDSSSVDTKEQGCEISFLNEKLRLRSEKAQRQTDEKSEGDHICGCDGAEKITDVSNRLPNLMCRCGKPAIHCSEQIIASGLNMPNLDEGADHAVIVEPSQKKKVRNKEVMAPCKNVQVEDGEANAKLPKISLRRKSVAQMEEVVENQENAKVSQRKKSKALNDGCQSNSKRRSVDFGIESTAHEASEKKKVALPGGPKKVHKRRRTIAEWEIHRRFDNDRYSSPSTTTTHVEATTSEGEEFSRLSNSQSLLSGGAFKVSEGVSSKKVPPLKIHKRAANSEPVNPKRNKHHESESGSSPSMPLLDCSEIAPPTTVEPCSSREVLPNKVRRKSMAVCLESIDLTEKVSRTKERKSMAAANEPPPSKTRGRRKCNALPAQLYALGGDRKSTLRNVEPFKIDRAKARSDSDSDVSGKVSANQTTRRSLPKRQSSTDQNVMIPLREYVPPVHRSPTKQVRLNSTLDRLFGPDSDDDAARKKEPAVPWKLRKVDEYMLSVKHGFKSTSNDVVFETTVELKLENSEKLRETAECKEIKIELDTLLDAVAPIKICADSVVTKQASGYDIEMENIKEINNLMQMHLSGTDFDTEKVVCTPDIPNPNDPRSTVGMKEPEPEPKATKKKSRLRNIKITPTRKHLNANPASSASIGALSTARSLNLDFNKFVADAFCLELWYPIYYNLKNCEMILKQMCLYRRLGIDLITAQEILRPYHNTWERLIDQLNVRIVNFFRHRTMVEFCYKSFLKHCYYFGAQRGTRVTLPSMIKFMCLVVRRMKETTPNLDFFMGLFCSSALLEYEDTVLKNAPLAQMWSNPVLLLAFQDLIPDENESTVCGKKSILTPAQERIFCHQVQDYCALIQNYYKLTYTMQQAQIRSEAAKRRPPPVYPDPPPPYSAQPSYRSPPQSLHNVLLHDPDCCSTHSNQNVTNLSYVNERTDTDSSKHVQRTNLLADKDFRIRLPLRVPQTEQIPAIVTPPLSSAESSTQTPTPTTVEVSTLVTSEPPAPTVDDATPETTEVQSCDEDNVDSKEHVRQTLALANTTDYGDDDIIDVDEWFIKKMRECDYIDLIDFDMSYSQKDTKNPPSDPTQNAGTTSELE